MPPTWACACWPQCWSLFKPSVVLGPTSTRQTRPYFSALMETDVSIYGDSNGLAKTVSVKARLRTVIIDPNVPAQFRPLSVKMKPLVACADSAHCAPVTLNPITVALTGALSNSSSASIAFNVPSAASKIDANLVFNRMDYAVSGNDFIVAGSAGLTRPIDPVVGSLPTLVCDRDLAKSRTQGCVFEEAAAVFVLDGFVPRSRQHVLEAWANPVLTDIKDLGRYLVADGSRAVASPDRNPLTRSRDRATIRANRSASHAKCQTEDSPLPPPPSCAPISDDPDQFVVDGPCDCDEFPFASTNQGALTFQGSVKRIPSADNRSAGARLGAFYTAQRVKDASQFWVTTK